MDLKPKSAAEILRMSDRQRANVEFANARVNMFKSEPELFSESLKNIRKMIDTRCESYINHVLETFADCDADKIKVSNRVAKPRKSERTFRSYCK